MDLKFGFKIIQIWHVRQHSFILDNRWALETNTNQGLVANLQRVKDATNGLPSKMLVLQNTKKSNHRRQVSLKSTDIHRLVHLRDVHYKPCSFTERKETFLSINSGILIKTIFKSERSHVDLSPCLTKRNMFSLPNNTSVLSQQA